MSGHATGRNEKKIREVMGIEEFLIWVNDRQILSRTLYSTQEMNNNEIKRFEGVRCITIQCCAYKYAIEIR